MLKDLFTFHSKEEDFRVKCLILILLGIALIISPVHAYTQMADFWGTNVSTYYFGSGITSIESPARPIREVTKIEWAGKGYRMNTSMATDGIWPVSLKATTTLVGNATFQWIDWDSTSASPFSESQVIITITDFNQANAATSVDMYVGATKLYEILLFKSQTGTISNGYGKYAITIDGFTIGQHYKTYNGSALPDAPVINDFTEDATCYYPGEYPILQSDVTGSVDDWGWSVYQNSTAELVWGSTDSVETIVEHYLQPGLYDAQLTVSNAGGYDTMFKYQYINVTQSGTCIGLGNWSPFPTVPTVTPTSAVMLTLTQPDYTVVNITGVNDLINGTPFNESSMGYRTYIDDIGNQFNATLVQAVSVVTYPFSTIINGLASAISLYTDAMASLRAYTTVPLAITGIVLSFMPWQIVTLITAGIAIDAILIMILGRT